MGHARFAVMAAAACLGSVAVVSAQNPDDSARFEVASIRLNTSKDARPNVDPTPGRFTATAVKLRDLVGMAYPVGQIVGGPDWIDTDRFDIVATGGPTDPNIRPAPGAVAPREGAALNTLRAMLRQLLRDRFRLRVHSEQRDSPIYALVQARSDRLGGQLRRFGGDCAKEAVVPDTTGAACGGFKFLGRGRLVAHAVTIPMLVSMLANLPDVGRIVQNRTALDGNFDLELSWIPATASREQSADTSQSVAPSLFTALEEQLGLRLEPSRGPVEVLLIDSAELPTPN